MNHYLLAVICSTTAVVLQAAIFEVPGSRPHLLVAMFFGAALIAAWFGGRGAGLLSTFVSGLCFIFFFIGTKHPFGIEQVNDFEAVLSLLIVSLIACWGIDYRPASETRHSSRQIQKSNSRPESLHILTFFIAYILGSGLGQKLPLIPNVDITFWPPSGIFVAALLLSPRAHWRYYVIAGGAAELTCNDLWFHSRLPLAIIYFAANAIEAFTAAWLLNKLSVRPFRLESPWQVLAFVVLAAGIAPILGATIIATTDACIGKHEFTTAWPLVWLGDGTGLLLSTPIALAVVQAWREKITAKRFIEGAFVAAILVVVEILAFWEKLPTVYLTMPLVLWIAVRFQLRGAAVALALVAITAASFATVNELEFDSRAKVVTLQIFLGVTGASALLVATLSYLHQQTLSTLESTNRDLERRVAERTESLSRERARLGIALRAGRMGVYECALSNGALWWSPETYQLFGLEPASFTPTVESFAGMVHPEDRDDGLQKVLTGEAVREVIDIEYRVILPNNTVRWIHNRARIERDSAGCPALVTGVVTDITDRKHDEEELRRLAAQLSEADRRKDEFLATLAHELRNPLAPLRNGLQILRMARAGEDEQAAEEVRTMMERQLAQMVHLIDDLLDVSRISSGKLELRKTSIELSVMLNNAIETSRPIIEAGNHHLDLNLPTTPIFLDADMTRLAQVFSNLLNNAAKYSEGSGHIRLSAELQSNDVLVSVKDSGIGIPDDMLPKIFDLFTQVDHSREKAQGGLGIGLSLVKRLVEMHNGTVEARSEGQGKGSEFIVRLPVALAKTAETSMHTDENTNAIPSSRCRILVADDNQDAVKTLAMMLKILGNEVHTANDGLQAVEMAATFKPDVMLLDIGMPKLNGYEACCHIREKPWGKSMVMIALTGWGQDDDKRRSQEAGFNHHLVKPVDFGVLEKLIDVWKTSRE